MVEQLNTIARLWWEWSAAMFWQVGLLILVIATIDRLTRRWTWPQLRYALWSLILIKLLLPPSLSLPSSVVPSVAPVVKQALARLQSDEPAAAESRAMLLLNEDMLSRPAASPLALSSFVVSDGEPVARVPAGASGEVSSLKYQVSSDEGQAQPPQTSNFTLQTSPMIWQVYAMMASFVGTLILGIWLFVRLHSLVGRRAQETAAASLPQSFYNQLAGCARRLELGWIPRVVVTKSLATPAVFGVFRPVLLMPKGYLSKLSRRDTEHMLLHELAHVKRGDLIAHGLYMLLQVVYWYNPLLWLVRRQVHHLRELSCDATVAELLREQTMAYRQTLLETARRLLTSSVEPGLGLLGLFEDSNRLLVRLDWLTKPTWRYRTMKRVTVATIAALMLACVLPMARAQEAASNPPSPEVVKHEDPSAQEIAALQAQLEKLMAQQRQLQEQLQALTQQRSQADGKVQVRHADPTTTSQVRRKQRTDQGNVTIVPWQDEDPLSQDARKLKDVEEALRVSEERARAAQEQAQSMDEQREAQVEAQRAQVEAQRAKMESLRAAAESERAKAEARRETAVARHARKMGDQMSQWAHSEQMQKYQADVDKQMQKYQADIDKWQNSDEMKRWEQEMEQWGQKMEKWGEEMGRRYQQGGESPTEATSAPGAASAVPAVPAIPSMPAMPTMPAMPPMPQMPPVPQMPPEAANVHVSTPHVVATPNPMPHVQSMPGAPVPEAAPRMKNRQELEVSCGDFVVQSVPAEATLTVENGVGDVAIEGAEGRECTVKATALIKSEDREEAEQLAKGVIVQVTPADGRIQVAVRMPEDLTDEQRNKISVNLQIAVPADANVQAKMKVGNLNLTSLQGKVTAAVDVGAVKTWDLQGDVAIRTNVGNIDFAVFRDLSAKIQAQAQIGSISSNLPLEISGAAVAQAGNAQTALGSHANGTLGQGKNTIDLAANVGSIQINWKEAPQKREVF